MNFLQAILSLRDETNGIFRGGETYGIGLKLNKSGKQILTSINDRGWADVKGVTHLMVDDILAEDWTVITLKTRSK